MDFDKNFKMFMTCRLPNPSFSPELSAKTTVIDFTVTQGGLEQQLLGKVISHEVYHNSFSDACSEAIEFAKKKRIWCK